MAINILARDWIGIILHWKERLNKLDRSSQANTILTPHPMELSRLFGMDLSDIADNIFDIANQCSYNNKLVYVLKDARTIVAEVKNILIYPEIMEWQPQEAEMC